MPKKIRLGLVPYLNIKPIVQPLLSGELEHNFSFYFAPPAQLAHALKNKKLELAFIPSIEYASNPDYLILPDLAISAKGAVESVNLYSKKPISEVKTVALDTASRTSAALLKILFAQHFQRSPEYIKSTPPLNYMLEIADAALVIGDNALQISDHGYYKFDLAQEWLKMTGQPFVFAFFAARQFSGLEESWQKLLQAREIGIQNIPLIAQQESIHLGLSYDTCLDYLSNRIHYDLSPEKIAGLKNFYKLAAANNVIREDVTLKFYQQTGSLTQSAPRWRMANA